MYLLKELSSAITMSFIRWYTLSKSDIISGRDLLCYSIYIKSKRDPWPYLWAYTIYYLQLFRCCASRKQHKPKGLLAPPALLTADPSASNLQNLPYIVNYSCVSSSVNCLGKHPDYYVYLTFMSITQINNGLSKWYIIFVPMTEWHCFISPHPLLGLP